MTIKSIIKQLNDEHCHPAGYHLSMLRMDLMPEDLASVNTEHDLMQQTYDWRYHPPEADYYTVNLSADDMRYIGNALEIYSRAMFELHIEPQLEQLIKKMGDLNEKAKEMKDAD